MLKNMRPIDFGNATIITNHMVSRQGLVMERLEDIFDFFAEEPVSVIINEEENGIEEEYIRILRIRIWNRMQKSFSWSIYSKEREILNNLIIRRVIWHSDKDKEYIKKNIRKSRADMLELWPSIEIDNKYILLNQSYNLISLIDNFDSSIRNGFKLYKNNNPISQWYDLEILRLYDWGQIHLTWCPNKKNDDIERRIKELILGLDSVIEKTNNIIYKMKLNYSIVLDEYIRLFL